MSGKERQLVKVTFPVEPNGIPELRCVVCAQDKCELVLDMVGDGRRVQVGIHIRCAERYGVEGSR